ncbi:putative ribonuclease H-like domain-containing protein [Tanacetum coccineum]|uniref:Ribonuclease H-like domain-containing protein n=1 Tax=Tanacetum coccineum TaxID=301880 RepID=A0ABQ5CSR3_9ASTR
MVEKLVLNNNGRVNGQREIRPVWNNAQRVNHQNKLTHPHPKRNFVPTTIATKSGQVLVNAAKQSSPRATSSISTARPVNTATPKPKVNDALPTTYSYFNVHSPIRRTFNQKSATKINNFNEKVNTPRVNNVTTVGPKAVVSVAEGNRENAVKSSVCWIWRPTGNVIDHISKDSGSYMLKRFDYVDLQDQGIFDSGCSRHMTGNKSFLIDYQEIDGGFKGKQHKASCKTKLVSSISQPLQMLHMDLFGPTFVKSINHKIYCLVVTDDFSRFSWVFFLATKDETSGILKTFITGIENQINHKVKIIRRDNETEFKNNDMNQFYGMKEIKREFSVARTPQQNGVAKRKNRTLIEAARTMLVDSLLPNTFWAEAVNTACYVPNRVLVTKPHNKTPYELLHGRPPSISFMRPFGCLVTILNTLDPLGKFDGKADEGFLIGYSINRKAFRVFNTRTRKVEENMHITFLENKPNVARSGPDWLFDIDLLINSMNYEPVTIGNQTNWNAGIKDNIDAVPTQQYIMLSLLSDSPKSSEDAVANNAGKKTTKELANKGEKNEESFDNADDLLTDPLMRDLEDTTNLLNTNIFSGAYDDEDVGAEADLNNLETTMNASPIPTTRIYKDHPKEKIIGDPLLAPQTRRMTKISKEHAMKVWTLVDLPNGKRAIGTKWVFRNKKDERGIVVRNKAILVAQGYTQEEGIDYDAVFAPVDRIKAIRAWYETLSTYLLENGFRRGTIDKTSFIKKDKGDILLVQVYVDDIIFGSTKKSLCVEFEQMMHKRFQMSSMGELTFFLGLQVKQKDDGIFISQDKYVADILKKFDFATVKTTSTPIKTNKALLKDEEAEDVDVHLYISMIGSLMYLTASRPDIMFVVCACARFQVTPKVSHLHAVKRIFRYLKGQPKLGLWYPRDSPFDLEAFSDSDYAGASLDRKSTTGGCQFLGKRLISWQCKKQTIVANSTTEAEYVAAANCCGQVLWIQNQMLDYGFNFMNTKIYIDNESTICIVKNPVFHSKTKHIEIRHHFIRDYYEKRLIQVIKIHIDHNVADVLTKAFDVSRYSLTISPTIYASYIEQFWATAKSKIVNNETQIHAKVDGKTIVISESSVRSNLHFNDEDGVTSLTNSKILENLALMGYEIKVEGLESDLMKIKKLYATAFKELFNRVKSLKEGFGDGQEVVQVSTAGLEVTTADAELNTASIFVSTASPQRNANTTADDLTLAKILMKIRKSAAKDKSKAKMDETESPRKMKQRERVQISRDEEVAQKLQEEFDAAERHRMAQVHQSAQGFTDDELG